MKLPYSDTTSGTNAMNETRRILMAFGCSKFAPMEDFEAGTVSIQFEYRGRMVQATASVKGYARAWLKQNPWTSRRRMTPKQHEEYALHKANIAVWSILRDWIKGQVTAVETEVLSFDAAFLGQILLPSGQTVHELVSERKLLPAPGDAP